MCEDDHGIGRRALIVTGATAALTLGSVTFSPGYDAEAANELETRTVRGTLPTGSPDFVYLPVEVPAGVRELKVAYTYEKPAVPVGTQGNALDIGIFDERGTALGGKGFRGWSGGARTEFFIRADDATPGYLPGPVREGTWHIALGPYTVAPQGLPYEITITLAYGEPSPAVKPTYPCGAREGQGPRLVPRRLPSALLVLRRPPHPGRDRGPRPCRGLGLHQHLRAQHPFRARPLGGPGG